MNKISGHNFKNVLLGGFTVIELTVSIAIVALVLGVVLARNTAFNSAVLLRSEAYDMALQIREVQLQAVSASGVVADYRRVAGLHFDSNSAAGFYQSFRDSVPGDNYFTSSDSNIVRRSLDPRFEIDSIQLVGGATVNNLSIVFRRPNFDALFYTASGVAAPASVTGARIVIRRVGTTGTGVGDIRTVEITRTGQITVQ